MSELTIYQLLAPDEINYLKSFGNWSNTSFIMRSEYLDMIGFGGNTTLLEQLDNWVESDDNNGNPSELENTLADSMSLARIYYDRQFPYALGLADFFIPPNHIVEVQGTFWHADPSKYSGNRMIKDKQAHEIWANDARKKCYLQQQGYKVLHLWEREITASIENVIKTIINSITSFSHSFSHSFFANVNLRGNNSSHVNDMEI
jgi:very-short-patch-repair endonuclease